MPEFDVDYRFMVEAKDVYDAAEKITAFLPDATDDIWYTIIHQIILHSSKPSTKGAT